MTDRLDLSRDTAYTYDNLDRLIDATRSADSWLHDHDANGNRTLKSHNGSTQNYQYPATSHRLSRINGANAKTFQYSANGQMINNGTRTFHYAAHNRLSSVQAGASTLAAYTYNGHGERVRKTVAGTPIDYHYGRNGQLLAETDGQGAWLKE